MSGNKDDLRNEDLCLSVRGWGARTSSCLSDTSFNWVPCESVIKSGVKRE